MDKLSNTVERMPGFDDYHYGETTQVIRKLSVRWSDYTADSEYILTTLHEYKSGERRIVDTKYGDVQWARRIANHYNIELPSEGDE